MSRRSFCAAGLLGLSLIVGGCASDDEGPEAPPAVEQRDGRPNSHGAPPLGNPRAKKIPGDQLDDEYDEEGSEQ